MSGKLNRDAYIKLIEENIAWLKSVDNTRGSSLEMRHIVDVLICSVRMYYDVLPAAERLARYASYVCSDVSLAKDVRTILQLANSMREGGQTHWPGWRPRGVVNHGWPTTENRGNYGTCIRSEA